MGMVNYEENYKAAALKNAIYSAICFFFSVLCAVSMYYLGFQKQNDFPIIVFGVSGLFLVSSTWCYAKYSYLIIKKKGYVVEDSYDGSLS